MAKIYLRINLVNIRAPAQGGRGADGWTDGWTNGWTDGQTNCPSEVDYVVSFGLFVELYLWQH